MIDKVIGTLKEYLAAHDRDIISLSDEQKAEIQAQIKYMELFKDFSYVAEMEEMKTRIDSLQNAVLNLGAPFPTSNARVTRKDFLEIHDKAEEGWSADLDNGVDEKDSKYFGMIYNNDFTVHWNGIYCDCLDGCNVSNYMIPAIKNIEEDSEGFEVDF